MLVHPKLLKAARQLLAITQVKLAKDAHVSERALRALEAEAPKSTRQTIERLQTALEIKYGVTFFGEGDTMGSGFRLPRGFLKKKSINARPLRKSRVIKKKP
jgi:DNA-binding XRE family transcriptional regulator